MFLAVRLCGGPTRMVMVALGRYPERGQPTLIAATGQNSRNSQGIA